MDFVFGLPSDASWKTGILVVVDRFRKMVHLIPVSANITAAQTASAFVDTIFRLHRMPEEIHSAILDGNVRAAWHKVEHVNLGSPRDRRANRARGSRARRHHAHSSACAYLVEQLSSTGGVRDQQRGARLHGAHMSFKLHLFGPGQQI